jgi:PAS domain S-box-containing protein
VVDRTELSNDLPDATDTPRAVVEERAAGLERHLAAAQQITHIGSWEWDLASRRVTWSDELYRIYGMEPRSREIDFELFLSKLLPEDRPHVEAAVARALEDGNRFTYRERIRRPDGSIRHLDTLGEVRRDTSGRICGLIGICRDITAETQAEKLRHAEQQILEMIASGAPLAGVLMQIVLMIEEQIPPTIGSILLLDERGIRLLTGAAPNLPPEFSRAIHGVEIGAAAGSCGTSAFLGRPVLVEDIETDPLWVDYRALASRFGLRACWSTPIVGGGGAVVGTFALYYREPRKPREEELAVIGRATHIAGIAIQRDRLTDELRALTAHVEAVREDERTSVAREIHDVLGQALTALKMDISWLSRHSVAEPTCAAKLQEMSAMTDDLVDAVRRISADLRPGVLDDLGLGAAIEWQAEDFQRRTGTTCIVHSNVGEMRFDRDVGTAVFRIFQEALTNVARHADATLVEVHLEQDGTRLRLSVRDDGRGISAEALGKSTSLGILGMRERARRLAGTVDLRRDGESGTVLVLELPVRARSTT